MARTSEVVMAVQRLFKIIRRKHPDWGKTQVSHAIAFARVGKGPFSEDWKLLYNRPTPPAMKPESPN